MRGDDDHERVLRQRLADAHRDFMEEMKPIVRIRCFVYSMAMPKIVLYSDGRMESSYEFSPEAQKILDQCSEYESHIADRYKRVIECWK